MKSIKNKGWINQNNSDLSCAIEETPSPFFNLRDAGAEISLLVLHSISLPPEKFQGDYIRQFFQAELDFAAHPYFASLAHLKVSAHFLIKRNGDTLQFVSSFDVAWHAGESQFLALEQCNDFSIGIELEGSENQPFTDIQYSQLVDLTKLLMKIHPGIQAERIYAHSDIAPSRKTDPGPYFDWRKFYRQLHS